MHYDLMSESGCVWKKKKDRPSSFSQSVIIVVLQVPAETLSANWAKVAAASS